MALEFCSHQESDKKAFFRVYFTPLKRILSPFIVNLASQFLPSKIIA
ncbi:MAG: hypothetical protein LBF15_02920 [Candidatus Peribacteria bacterium]|nr:hypothetical protein [Candidatus Peribacteria bacterium]